MKEIHENPNPYLVQKYIDSLLAVFFSSFACQFEKERLIRDDTSRTA
jgi:hypothetical protein